MNCAYPDCQNKAVINGLCALHADPDAIADLWDGSIDEFRARWSATQVGTCAIDNCCMDAIADSIYCAGHAQEMAVYKSLVNDDTQRLTIDERMGLWTLQDDYDE